MLDVPIPAFQAWNLLSWPIASMARIRHQCGLDLAIEWVRIYRLRLLKQQGFTVVQEATNGGLGNYFF
jgi:G:T/U-mismatch repair DNA glycosylase